MSGSMLRDLIEDESGATAIEYGLIAMLIAVAVIGSFTLVGNNVMALFNNGTAEVIASRTARIQ